MGTLESISATTEELLRTRNLKVTPIRVAVLSLLTKSYRAVPYSELHRTLTDFDRVTLYRTLTTFLDAGIIHKASTDEKDTHYALCEEECDAGHHHHAHIHFKCTECHQVSCVSVSDEQRLSLPGYEVKSLSVEATGVCPECG